MHHTPSTFKADAPYTITAYPITFQGSLTRVSLNSRIEGNKEEDTITVLGSHAPVTPVHRASARADPLHCHQLLKNQGKMTPRRGMTPTPAANRSGQNGPRGEGASVLPLPLSGLHRPSLNSESERIAQTFPQT